ncbi:MAG: DUF4386 domain-containing protein [Caldilineaceae bacterium]
MNTSKWTTRSAGILYLLIIASGIFAQFMIRGSMIIPGDAAATYANIAADPSGFGMSIAADLVMIMSDVALAALFFVLLRPVSTTLSLMAALFRLTQAAILGLNLIHLFRALQLVSGEAYLAAFSVEQLQAQVLLAAEAHGIGYSLGLVFFGVQCALLGYLLVRSGYFPKVLGFLMIFAGIGYLVDCFAGFFLPTYADYADIFAIVVFVPAIIGELSLALWLLIKGVKPPQQETTSASRPAQKIATARS